MDNENRIPKRYEKRKKPCGNCGKIGHYWRSCMEPITSYGLCAVRVAETDATPEKFREQLPASFDDGTHDPATVRILLVQRKDTMGFVDFLRGRYSATPEIQDRQIRTFFSEMTHSEREKFIQPGKTKTEVFNSLWRDLWVNHRSKSFTNEFGAALEKFKKIDYQYYLASTTSKWKYTEWGIPKGRRNKSETNLECAEREFREESGYSRRDYVLLDPDNPIIELFYGTNGEQYKHVYFLAQVFSKTRYPEINLNNNNQAGEIRQVGWFSEKQALELVRDYDQEKKKIISHVFDRVRPYFKTSFSRLD